MIKERDEVLAEIANNKVLQEKFDGWQPEQQEEFLEVCTGVKGLRLLYDGFFKEIMNPEYAPERFNDFLSGLLGQRCACYSADLLLRQYKRIRGERKKQFSYRDIKSVYTIVIFEKSPKEFHKYPEKYYHFFEQKSDTGLQIEFLQKYLLIPLDIYGKSQQNRNINGKREAWLTLLSSDDPEMIIKLIEKYPEFREYQMSEEQIQKYLTP